SGRYSYHWNRFEIDGMIYRYDNAPHKVWSHVTTFPHHFHNKNDFFTKNRVKTALRVGLAIYFFVNGNDA
ncbi:MAG: DUF6516 family protein, partial [Euryarchaeota archaeon]|nr:DUF6516 family protein [Euryarchaeota archaeon]